MSNDADRMQLLAGRHVLGADDHLLEHPDEVVDVVQTVVLHVERVAAEQRPVREQHPSAPGAGMSTTAPIANERLRTFTACDFGHLRVLGEVDVRFAGGES